MVKEKKTSFPMLPVKHWWSIGKKFKQSIPGTVTDKYLSAALEMEIKSARANILPYLEALGIIDEDGKTLDRAKQWRDDSQYADVCKQILSEVYPEELLNIAQNPNEDRRAASRWFAIETGAGEVGVKRMVSIYLLLLEADPSAEVATPIKKTAIRSSDKPKPKKKTVRNNSNSSKGADDIGDSNTPTNHPDININLQIHISSDATPDQIDKIFESMSKHIYKKD